MNILYVYADSVMSWNSSQWRCLTPSNAINEIYGWSSNLVSTEDFATGKVDRLIDAADVIVFQHNIVLDVFKHTIEMLRGIGKSVVVDIDDSYMNMPVSNGAYSFWNSTNDDGVVMSSVLSDRIAMADALTSPSRLILQDYADIARSTYYVPNLAEDWWLDKDVLDFKRIDGERRSLGVHDMTVIGWGGSVSHLESWLNSGAADASGLLCDTRDDVVFMICGYDKRIYDFISAKRKIHCGFMSPNEWVKMIPVFDIGIAPVHGEYDRRRSNLKVMEYSLAGVPWVASALDPYMYDDDMGMLVNNDTRSWHVCLHALAMNIADEKRIAMNQIPEARDRFLASTNSSVYSDVYSEIVKSNSYHWKAPMGVTYVNW